MVADAKMVEHHGQPDVESYVLTIMNMVRLPQASVWWGGVVRGCQEVVLGNPKGYTFCGSRCWVQASSS